VAEGKRHSVRYDAVMERHHNLYRRESERIEDFVDAELNEVVGKCFKKRRYLILKLKM